MIARARLAVALLALALPCPTRQEAHDPELSSEGRSTYFGREIARTMHWSGAEWLLRETRADEENTRLLLESLGIREGEAVCDFGCGNGYYTLPFAERVGPNGRVFAVDIQQEMLDMLAERAAERELENLERVLGDVRDPKLPAASCDLVCMIDVYHELSHPESVLARVRAALKDGGRLVIVEFRLEDPTVPIKRRHKMAKSQVLLELAANGFVLEGEFDGLPRQHLLRFVRDAAWPRTEGQEVFEGRAVVDGFWRALCSADELGVRGYFGGARSFTRRTMVRVGREPWRASMERFTPRIRLATEGDGETVVAGDLVLEASAEGGLGRWVFRRNDDGRWPIVSEYWDD